MALAAAGRAEQQDIGALAEPGVAGRERHHLGLRDHRHAVEVEGGERLAGRQTGLGKMPLDAAAAAIGHLVLGEAARKRAAGQPSLSDCSASLAHISLTPGRRSSLNKSSTRAASMVVLLRHATASRLEVGYDRHDDMRRQFVVGVERDQLHIDDRHRCRGWAEAFPQRRQVRQSSGIEFQRR